MRKLFSTYHSDKTFNAGMLILRICVGGVMAHHGYIKLSHFSEMNMDFMDFMGLGAPVSLGLVIFAELVCSVFIVLGLATRLAAIPLIITMLVAMVSAHHFDIFGKGELATVYLAAYILILIAGAGGYSADALISRDQATSAHSPLGS